jgi:hypothetical protein
VYSLHPESERPAHPPIESLGYFFFFGRVFFGVCAKSEAAVVLTSFGALGLANNLPASCAGFFPVATSDPSNEHGTPVHTMILPTCEG